MGAACVTDRPSAVVSRLTPPRAGAIQYRRRDPAAAATATATAPRPATRASVSTRATCARAAPTPSVARPTTRRSASASLDTPATRRSNASNVSTQRWQRETCFRKTAGDSIVVPSSRAVLHGFIDISKSAYPSDNSSDERIDVDDMTALT